MKKHRKAVIKYYATLLSGVLIFVPFIVFDSIFPGSVNKYGILFCSWLILGFVGYLYAIKKVVGTKEFMSYEEESQKKTDAFIKYNKDLIKKIIKICLVVDIPLTILVLVFIIMYFCYGIEGAVIGNYYHMFWVFYNIILFGLKYNWRNDLK